MAKRMAVEMQDSKARVQAAVLTGETRAEKQAGLALLNVYLPTKGNGDERENAEREKPA